MRLGLAARGQAKVKVRQPLREAVVVAAGREREAIERLADVVREELNVKELRFVAQADELGCYEVKPNYRTLGPRFGKTMPQVAAAVAALDPAHVARRCATAARRHHRRRPRPRARRRRPPLAMHPLEGYQLEREGTHAVALELALDDELRREGWAREIVHAVQTARKAAGLAVEDRIALALGGDDGAARRGSRPRALRQRARRSRPVAYDGVGDGDAPPTIEGRELHIGSRRPGLAQASAGSSSASRRFLGIAPRMPLAAGPFLKRIIVGIARTSNCAAVCWLSSMLSLTIRRSSRSRRSPRGRGRRRGTGRTTAPRSRRARGPRPR